MNTLPFLFSFQLTIILGTTVLLAHVVGWGWEDDDYDTDYNDYMDSLNDEYEDYYMYDQYGEKETKCGIKPKCPKINAGECLLVHSKHIRKEG